MVFSAARHKDSVAPVAQVALLVFFRLWRVVRIMHSLMEALELNHEEVTKQHHAQVAQLQKVRSGR